MCERAGFQQETSLILYEVIYLCSTHLLTHSICLFLTCYHSSRSSLRTLVSGTRALSHNPSCAYFHTVTCSVSFFSSLTLLCSSLVYIFKQNSFVLALQQVTTFSIISCVCVAGSKAQSNRADTGLRCLSGQGPGRAHGRGHHCLPKVRQF